MLVEMLATCWWLTKPTGKICQQFVNNVGQHLYKTIKKCWSTCLEDDFNFSSSTYFKGRNFRGLYVKMCKVRELIFTVCILWITSFPEMRRKLRNKHFFKLKVRHVLEKRSSTAWKAPICEFAELIFKVQKFLNFAVKQCIY